MEPLEGIYIQEVTCGYGHTLFIARDEEKDLPLLNKLPVYDPDKVILSATIGEVLHKVDWLVKCEGCSPSYNPMVVHKVRWSHIWIWLRITLPSESRNSKLGFHKTKNRMRFSFLNNSQKQRKVQEMTRKPKKIIFTCFWPCSDAGHKMSRQPTLGTLHLFCLYLYYLFKKKQTNETILVNLSRQ